MINVYLILDYISTIIIKSDNNVAFYEENDIDSKTLDKLYFYMTEIKADSLTVITNSLASSDVMSETYTMFKLPVNNTEMYCSILKDDVHKIISVARAANVEKIKFIDKLGLYFYIGNLNCCYVDLIRDNLYQILSITEQVQDISYCTSSNVRETLSNVIKKSNIDNVVSTEGIRPSIVALTTETEELSDKFYSNLYLVEYSESELAETFTLSLDGINTEEINKLDFISNDAVSALDDSDPNEDAELNFFEEQEEKKSNAQIKLRKVKKDKAVEKSENKNSSNKNKLPTLLKFIFILLCISNISYFGVNYYLNSKYNREFNNMINVSNSVKKLESNTKYLESYKEQLENDTITYSINKLSVSGSNSKIVSINYLPKYISIDYFVPSKSKYSYLKKKLNKNFNVISSQNMGSIKINSEEGYQYNFVLTNK